MFEHELPVEIPFFPYIKNGQALAWRVITNATFIDYSLARYASSACVSVAQNGRGG